MWSFVWQTQEVNKDFVTGNRVLLRQTSESVELVLELGNGQRLENFEECDRKGLECLEQAAGGNAGVKGVG